MIIKKFRNHIISIQGSSYANVYVSTESWDTRYFLDDIIIQL